MRTIAIGYILSFLAYTQPNRSCRNNTENLWFYCRNHVGVVAEWLAH